MIRKLLSFVLTSVIFNLVQGKGNVALDIHNFDKILSKFHTTLVKFDIAFPYGPKHEVFLQVAESSIHRPDFLVAEVGVKDYGDRDNEDLAKRFNIDTKEFPVYLLFVKDVKDPFVFKGKTDEDYSVENVINFVRSKAAGIWIGAPGCLQDFDSLAKQFIQSVCPHQRKSLLKAAEDLWDGVKSQSARRSAETYVKTMRKLISLDGAEANDFLVKEKSRVKGLLNEKVSSQKKDELKARVNILDSFALHANKGKDEL